MNPINPNSSLNGTNYFSLDQSTKKALQRQFNDLIDQFSETLTKEQNQILVTRKTKEGLKKILSILGTQFSKGVFAKKPIINPSFDQESLLSITECIQNLGNDKNVLTEKMCESFRDIIKRTISVVPGQLKNTLKELDDAFAEKEARLSSSPHIPSAPPLPSPSDNQNTANENEPPPQTEFKDELALRPAEIEKRVEENLNKEGATQKASKTSEQPSAEKKKKSSDQQATQNTSKTSEQPSAEKKKKSSDQQATQNTSKTSEQPSAEKKKKSSDQQATQKASKTSEQPSAEKKKKSSDQQATQNTSKTSEQPSAEKKKKSSDQQATQKASKTSEQPSAEKKKKSSDQQATQKASKTSEKASAAKKKKSSDQQATQNASKAVQSKKKSSEKKGFFRSWLG